MTYPEAIMKATKRDDLHVQNLMSFRPPVCKDARCQVALHLTCAYEIHIRHNSACLSISEEQIDNPTKDIWGEMVIPWLQGFHNAD